MNLKNLTLASALVLAIPSLALVSCKKEAGKITVKITADDANTARTWIGDSLNSTVKSTGRTSDADLAFRSVVDSLASKQKNNVNDAVLKSVKVSYVNQKGKKFEKEFKDSEAQKFATGFDLTDVGVGKEITVIATATEGEGGKIKVIDRETALAILKQDATEHKVQNGSTTNASTRANLAKKFGLSKEANGGGAAEARIVTLTVDIAGGTTPVTQKKTGEAGKEVTVDAKATGAKGQ